MGLDVKADENPTVFGKNVSDLQSNIEVKGNQVTGTLAYVTDFTGFSGDPELQEGNYLALSFDSDPEADKIEVEFVGALTNIGPQELDSDKDICVRITNKDTQYIVATAYKGGEMTRRTIKLDQLVLEPEE